MGKYKSFDEYIAQIPEDRLEAFLKLRKVLKENLPEKFEEIMQYDMISYAVPRSIYPDGYHCNPEDELVFISLGNQKSHIALYHSGMYMDEKLSNWFQDEYKKVTGKKADMWKSCIRFKKMDQIPYDLIAELAKKVTPEEYVEKYTSILNNRKK